jgi:hypothetical protein
MATVGSGIEHFETFGGHEVWCVYAELQSNSAIEVTFVNLSLDCDD